MRKALLFLGVLLASGALVAYTLYAVAAGYDRGRAAGVIAGVASQERKVVLGVRVYACGKYVGAFVSTGDGHWHFISQYQAPEGAITSRFNAQLPKYAVADLDPTRGAEGACPPSIEARYAVP